MEEHSFSNVDEIENYLSGLGAGALFRGQVSHYTTDSGEISIVSSQGRKGCVPNLLFKWTHYASEILRILCEDQSAEIESDLAQAVLQHYGWRSFFIDLTSNYAVAAWFASHRWSAEHQLTLTEDCFEEPLITIHEVASYTPADKLGHLYIVSREELARANVNCIDLCEVLAINFRARFKAQDAWLAGPLSDKQLLPPSSIIAHISAPAPVLAAVASKHGVKTVQELFPTRGEDIFLELLLKVPRRSLGNRDTLGGFYPDLPIPEYDFRVIKPFPPEFAFYEEFWLADDRDSHDFRDLKETLFVRVDDHLLYLGRPRLEDSKFPLIMEKLREHQSLAIESNGIAKILGPGINDEYSKGLHLRLVADSLVEIGELVVEHPGTELTGAGVNRGWYYHVEMNGTWIRTEREDQCPCNNPVRHLRHLWSLYWVEEIFARAKPYDVRTKDISFLGKSA